MLDLLEMGTKYWKPIRARTTSNLMNFVLNKEIDERNECCEEGSSKILSIPDGNRIGRTEE